MMGGGPFSCCCFGGGGGGGKWTRKDQPQKLGEDDEGGGASSSSPSANNNISVVKSPKSADKLLNSAEAWTPVGLDGGEGGSVGGGGLDRNASHLLTPLEGTKKAIDFDRHEGEREREREKD